jgi:hypothetical protein
MVLWCYGVMVLWCYGVMVLWCYGVMVEKEGIQGNDKKVIKRVRHRNWEG